jgi:hypothetical protein
LWAVRLLVIFMEFTQVFDNKGDKLSLFVSLGQPMSNCLW